MSFPQPTEPIDPPLTLEALAKQVEHVTSALRDIDGALAKAIDAIVARVVSIEERLVLGGIASQVSTDPMLGPSARKMLQNGNEIIRAYAADFNAAEVARLTKENTDLAYSVKLLKEAHLDMTRKAAGFNKENEHLRDEVLRLVKAGGVVSGAVTITPYLADIEKSG